MQETEAERERRLVVECLTALKEAVGAVGKLTVANATQLAEGDYLYEALRRAHSILGDLRSGK